MRRDRRDQGFALVAALWASVVLALIAGSVLHLARSDARLARVREAAAEQSVIADAVLTLMIQRLRAVPAMQPPVDGTLFTVPFADQVIRVSVVDEIGKVDLNRGNEQFLRLALMAAGLEAADAMAMADRILDWRDPAPERRPGGAKAEDYRAAGYAHAPRGAAFRSVGELRMVLGMTEALYARLAPMVTVYSETSIVDPAYSDTRLLLAMRTSEPAAELALRQREEERMGLAPLGAKPTAVQGHAFTISVETPSGLTRSAVIRLTGRPEDPVWTYLWR